MRSKVWSSTTENTFVQNHCICVLNKIIYSNHTHTRTQGNIRGNDKSRVALSTCDGINGVVFDGAETFYIQSGAAGDNDDDNDHFLFRFDCIYTIKLFGINFLIETWYTVTRI